MLVGLKEVEWIPNYRCRFFLKHEISYSNVHTSGQHSVGVSVLVSGSF